MHGARARSIPERLLEPNMHLRPRLIPGLTFLGFALAVVLFAAPAMAQSADAHAQHATHVADPATLPASPRWATDAPLQRGMRDIRQAVAALEHVQHGHLDATQAPAFADQIQAAVNDMIANCKLAPDADAELHALLVRFVAGANQVRTGPVTLEVLKPMQEALAAYPTRFDDPGWNAAQED
jgi:hypothetical protein